MAIKTEQMYEGKAKKVFRTDDPDLVIVSYKDDATAFNGLKKGTIVGKGVVNNKVSNHMFKMLEKEGVKTHFVEELSDRETVVKRRAAFPSAWESRREQSWRRRFSNIPIKTTSWAIP